MPTAESTTGKTDRMVMIELREGKAIDVILLDALRDAAGNMVEAGKLLKIDQSTFSRWIQALNLQPHAAQIRKHFNVTPTAQDLALLEPQEDWSIRIKRLSTGGCLDCGMEVEELGELLLTKIELRRALPRIKAQGLDPNTVVLIARDRLLKKHWIAVDQAKLNAGISV